MNSSSKYSLPSRPKVPHHETNHHSTLRGNNDSRHDKRASPKPNQALIDELYHRIRHHPPGLDARKRLMDHFATCGDLIEAERQAKKILNFSPYDKEANKFLQKQSLKSGTNASQNLHNKQGRVPQPDQRHTDQRALAPTERKTKSLPSAHTIASKLKKSYDESRSKALTVACDDLRDVAAQVQNDRNRESSDRRREAAREALRKRVRDLKPLLPSHLRPLTETAFMHAEHEFLSRKYVNDETMYMNPVSEIPRARFWVSDEGYAWDMKELAKAIESNNGVMRNPLSKVIFTEDDVRAIVHHPLGKHLAAMEISQRELRKGVRPDTIDKLGRLSETLLKDDEETGFVPSRRGLEAFKAYAATLPAAEQKAIDHLMVPARDSHTGWGFDVSIGEAIEAAMANRLCFHKLGDLLGQAAMYLRRYS
ncbi:hypothetical protein ACLMJK_004241 [Lecanora helva]